MARFTIGFKESAVKKALTRSSDMSIKDVSNELGIGYSTLQKWIANARNNNVLPDNQVSQYHEKSPHQWTREDRLSAIIATATLDNQAISEYCRKNGIYNHHLIEWKKEFIVDAKKENKSELRALKEENRQLKKELVRKEKALAEAAALLVLKKKAQNLLGCSEDN